VVVHDSISLKKRAERLVSKFSSREQFITSTTFNKHHYSQATIMLFLEEVTSKQYITTKLLSVMKYYAKNGIRILFRETSEKYYPNGQYPNIHYSE